MENQDLLLKEAELAYAAGILDGEGCIHIHNNNIKSKKSTQNFELKVHVSNTDRKMIDFLKQKFNGNITFRKKRTKSRLDSYKWYLCGKRAEDFLRVIFPYLITKREKAVLALKFRKTFETNYIGKGKIPTDVLEKRRKLKLKIQDLTRTRKSGYRRNYASPRS